MRPAFGSVSHALALVEEGLRSDELPFSAICSFASELAMKYAEHFDNDDDTDLSLDMLWLFSAELFSQCRKYTDGLIDAATIRNTLTIWLPYLAKGQDAWEEAAQRGESPFDWTE